MTYEQFYYKSCFLTVAYRKAHKIRRNQANFDAYLQGTYFYTALIKIAPMLHAFSKNPKAEPWLEKPFELYSSSDHESNIEAEEEKKTNAGLEYMQAFIAAYKAQHSSEDEVDTAKPK